jgi:hypothetical protein
VAIVLPKLSRNYLSGRSRSSSIDEPELGVRLLSLQPCFLPGDVLEAEYSVVSPTTTSATEPSSHSLLSYIPRGESEGMQGLEISVIWYTEGKGTEDSGVHYFERITGSELQRKITNNSCNFSTKLPISPLSYEGQLLNLRWCVRLRLFTSKGNDVCAQVPFYLGHVTREV